MPSRRAVFTIQTRIKFKTKMHSSWMTCSSCGRGKKHGNKRQLSVFSIFRVQELFQTFLWYLREGLDWHNRPSSHNWNMKEFYLSVLLIPSLIKLQLWCGLTSLCLSSISSMTKIPLHHHQANDSETASKLQSKGIRVSSSLYLTCELPELILQLLRLI